MRRSYCLFAVLVALALALPRTALAEAEAEDVAIFAGGCFWCVEEFFDEVDGVLGTTSGYTGGHTEDPTYEEVVAGGTGHTEAVEVTYDPGRVSYDQLLEVFWRNVDPLDGGGQFCDRGQAYRSGIFYLNAEQKALAETSRAEVAERFDAEIATEITEAGPFYEAEEYHQGYYHRNPLQYSFYKTACGREARLRELWGGS